MYIFGNVFFGILGKGYIDLCKGGIRNILGKFIDGGEIGR